MKRIIQYIDERLHLNNDSKVTERKINFQEFIKLIDGKSKYGKFKSNLSRGIKPIYRGKKANATMMIMHIIMYYLIG